MYEDAPVRSLREGNPGSGSGGPGNVAGAERRGHSCAPASRLQALGGGFVAALAATALLAGMSLAHARGGSLVAAGQPSHHPNTSYAGAGQVSATSSPSSSPTVTSTAGVGILPTLAPRYEMPVARMLDALRRLLPAGSTLGYVNPYSTQPGTVEVTTTMARERWTSRSLSLRPPCSTR